MFGFSIQKLLFTILVIVIVWYGFKLLARVQDRRREEGAAGRTRVKRRSATRAPADAEDMEACARCDTFVAVRNARSCGRDDCPYPG